MPQTRRVTVRLPPTLHRIVEDSARREGVATAQYIREATLMRIAYEAGAKDRARPDTLWDGVRELERRVAGLLADQ